MSKSPQPNAIIFLFVAKICAFVIPLIFVACNDKDDLGPAPVIRSFGPSSGLIGTPVVILGDQFIPAFSPDSIRQPNTSIITFNGTAAVAEYVYQDSIGKQRINTIVPSGATSGKITATTNGITVSSADEFIITVPTYLPNVTVSTVANYGGFDIATDSNGDLYVSEDFLLEIVKITPDGTISTIWSSSPDAVPREYPRGIAVDTQGNVFAAIGNSVQKISPDGKVVTLAGGTEPGDSDGAGADARFNYPWGIAVDDDANIYVADLLNCKIRKINSDGIVSTLAGSTCGYKDGQGTSAQFGLTFDVALDGIGNIYVTDGKIRKVTKNGLVTTVVENMPGGYLDGSIANAQFNGPWGIILDPAGNLYICDSENFVVRRIAPDGTVVTVAGSTFGNVDGPGSSAKFGQTKGLAMDATGALYLTQGGGIGWHP